MSNQTLMDRIKILLGINQHPPRNEFRNPIWGSNDDDDGDELYERQHRDMQVHPYDMHRDITKHVHDLFSSVWRNMLGDVNGFYHDDNFAFPDNSHTLDDIPERNIRDYYLKPGYHKNKANIERQDTDLDGKISTNDISGLLKKKSDADVTPFGNSNDEDYGKSFFETVITTSVTRSDGTVETRRIVKKGNGVVEDTTVRSPNLTNMDSQATVDIYNSVISDFSNIWRLLH